MMIFFIILAISIMILIQLTNTDDERCNCKACSSGYSGWRTEEYASQYPDCKHNIFNQK